MADGAIPAADLERLRQILTADRNQDLRHIDALAEKIVIALVNGGHGIIPNLRMVATVARVLREGA